MRVCSLTHTNVFPSDWHLGLAEWADAVVAVVGFSPLMEGEQGECIGAPDGGDKSDIALPPNQLQLLRDLKGRGKPIIAVVTGGCPIELAPVHEIADAVLMAWYPGERGGLAVGDVLFGAVSPSGKLPATFPTSIDQLPAYTDYRLEGRTYRYMTEEPMYPFGFGLSYARFAYADVELTEKTVRPGQSLDASVTVVNTGQREADEVVQLYLTDVAASVPAPRFALKAFKRVTLEAGESMRLTLRITPEMMVLYDANGDALLEPGTFTVSIGGSAPDARSIALGASAPCSAEFVLTSD